MKKSTVFQVHSIAGLLSGLFILLMSLSGSVLVFHEEIDQWQSPDFKPDANAPLLSTDRAYQLVREQYPKAQVSNCQLTHSLNRPYLFFIYDSSYQQAKQALKIVMHPQTGNILSAEGSANNFSSRIDKLHGTLYLGKTGEWLLGFLSLVFVISLLSGIVLYRRSIVGVLTFRKQKFRLRNLHQLVGVYALLFNLVIAITGFWMQRYVFKTDFYKSYSYTPVIRASPVPAFSLDSAITATGDRVPFFTPYVVYFAQSSGGKTPVYGSRSTNSFIHSKKYADMIALDSTGAVASTRLINEIDPADRYDIINSQVHYGRYGGWPVKLIYCLLGLSGGILSITGFFIWYRRKSRMAAMSKARVGSKANRIG